MRGKTSRISELAAGASEHFLEIKFLRLQRDMFMENPSEYLLRLKKIEEIASKTLALYFEKPNNFSFVPGQSIDILHPERDEKRTFSIAGAPHEDYILIAMRLRGSHFKKYLSKLREGDTVTAAGPFGKRFVLPDSLDTPLVFIAGGIGITPILSMLNYIAREKLGTPIALLYSNKNENDISFRKRLEQLSNENENIHVIYTLTNKYGVSPEWSGEVGRVDGEMVKKYVSDIAAPLFYTSGTPQMVTSMKTALEKMGVPVEHIVTKKFTGYEV